MGRRRDKLLRAAAVGLCRDAIEVGKWIRSFLPPSQMGEEHSPGILETVVEVSNGSSVANPVTSETADYAFQADELPLEIAIPAEEFPETADYASQADELPLEIAIPAEEVSEAQIDVAVDESLIEQPTPRQTNPTTVILPKINMEYAIVDKDKKTVLYEKQRGQWVAEPLPESTAEMVAPTVPTYPNNGERDFRRIVHA